MLHIANIFFRLSRSAMVRAKQAVSCGTKLAQLAVVGGIVSSTLTTGLSSCLRSIVTSKVVRRSNL